MLDPGTQKKLKGSFNSRQSFHASMASVTMQAQWACLHNYSYYFNHFPNVEENKHFHYPKGCLHSVYGARPIGYCKLLSVLDLFQRGYDWVVVLGTDAWVKNSTASLNDLLIMLGVEQATFATKSMFLLENRFVNYDLWPLPPKGHNTGTGVANADIMFVKNTAESIAILKKWWDIQYETIPGSNYEEISALWYMLGLNESAIPRTFTLPKDALWSQQIMVLPDDASPISLGDLRDLPKSRKKGFDVNLLSKAPLFLAHVPGSFEKIRRDMSYKDLFTEYGLPDFPQGMHLLVTEFFSNSWQSSFIWSHKKDKLSGQKLSVVDEQDNERGPIGAPIPVNSTESNSCAPIYQLFRNGTFNVL